MWAVRRGWFDRASGLTLEVPIRAGQYLPNCVTTLLRNRERILDATSLDEWAATEATPSEDEITRRRAPIRRVQVILRQLRPFLIHVHG